MKNWLVKFAPFRVSWKDILLAGKFEIYGVKNTQAINYLKRMKVGDKVFYYHSQVDRCIAGIMKVTEEAHQDKTTADPQYVSVTFEPIHTFKNPIPLSYIKSISALEELSLIKQPKLAVMEVSKEHFDILKSTSN